MRFLSRPSNSLVACLTILALSSGCNSSGTIKVTGTVLRDGKPLPISTTGVVQVTLIPDVAAGTPYTTSVGRCDANGKFEILEVKPGKYKIVIEQLDPNPATDKLAGAFGKDKTPIVRDIDGKKPVEIDLAHP
jgi:hypothetical protein